MPIHLSLTSKPSHLLTPASYHTSSVAHFSTVGSLFALGLALCVQVVYQIYARRDHFALRPSSLEVRDSTATPVTLHTSPRHCLKIQAYATP